MDKDSDEPWLLVADGELRGNRGGIYRTGTGQRIPSGRNQEVWCEGPQRQLDCTGMVGEFGNPEPHIPTARQENLGGGLSSRSFSLRRP